MRNRLGILALCGVLSLFAGPAAAGRPAPAASLPDEPVLRYEIWVDLNDDAKTLRGKEDIVWTNRSREAVSDMCFHLYWNAFKNAASTFFREAAEDNPLAGRGGEPADGDWGWIDVTDIRLADGRDLGPTKEFVRRDEPVRPGDQTVLRVRFPEPVKPGDNVRLRLEFRSQIPRTVARSGYYRNSYFIAQWFPKPGVFEEGKGWNCHEYHESSEFYADFADFVVHITVPENFVVGASGQETDAGPAAQGRVTRTFRQAMIHDFAWTADPRYLKVERTFVAAREVSPREYRETAALLGLPVDEVKLPDVKMILLIAPEHRRQIDRHFKALAAALKYYGLWYGPYPYETVTMVDPPFRTESGGMEYPTLFTAGTDLFAPRDVQSPEGVIVHEFGHGYWYGLVANNEFEEAWLDEGFNTYSTGRVLAKAYGWGAVSFVDVLGLPLASIFSMPKTLDFETDRATAINVVRYDPVRTFSWRFFNSLSYGANVYSRASTCLNTLERLLGEQAMARIMRTYHMRWRFKHPRAADFIGVVNEVSGRDMTWFFDEFLSGTLNFDYGVASVVCREEPRRVRGVFDVDDRKEEMTSKRIRELEAKEAPKAGREKAEARETYLTTVVLRRYGEARVGGDVRVKVVVTFEDGRRETAFWDGRDRWTRLTFSRPARAVGAQIDPDGVWLVDSNMANNSYLVRPVRRGLVSLLGRLLWIVQNVLQSVSSFS